MNPHRVTTARPPCRPGPRPDLFAIETKMINQPHTQAGLRVCSKCGATHPATTDFFYRVGGLKLPNADYLRGKCIRCTKAIVNPEAPRGRYRRLPVENTAFSALVSATQTG
jgi:hypothetical protein